MYSGEALHLGGEERAVKRRGREEVDLDEVSLRYELTGGFIRNAVLSALMLGLRPPSGLQPRSSWRLPSPLLQMQWTFILSGFGGSEGRPFSVRNSDVGLFSLCILFLYLNTLVRLM